MIAATVRLALSASALALFLSACASAPKPVGETPSASPSTASPAGAPTERLNKAIGLLTQGKAAEARVELLRVLQMQPANDTARKLMTEIDADPKTLLGAKAYPYRARPGDTASTLAERLLGDPLMFYALARYNGIDPPSQALDGRTVMIPGEPKVAPAPKPSAPKPAAPAPAAANKDPARAAVLRKQGLTQLNQGAIDRAVQSLRRAAELDPDNALIKRDLDRAVRIQKTVKSR